MQVDFYRGAPALHRFVSGHCVAYDVSEPVDYRVPAMMPNIYIRLAGTTHYRFADGREIAAPPVAVLGPTTAAFDLCMSAGTILVCVAILPEGWPAFSRVPATLLTDLLLDAENLWPAAALRALVDELGETPLDAGYVAVVERFLHARAAARDAEIDRRLVAVDAWLEGSGTLSIDALCDRLDLSARQATRLTHSIYGTSPKTLAMKYRALRGATTIAVHGAAGMIQAAEGYADQSHMIRDFHRFVGWTPRVYARERAAIASATILGRWRAGFRPMGIWG